MGVWILLVLMYVRTQIMFALQESILYEVSARVGLLFEIFPMCNSVLKVKVLVTCEEFTGCKCSQIIKKVKSSHKMLPLQLPSDGSTTSIPFLVNIFSSKFPDGHQGFTTRRILALGKG